MTVEEVTLAADRLRKGETAYLPQPVAVRSLILLVELLGCKAEDVEVLPGRVRRGGGRAGVLEVRLAV